VSGRAAGRDHGSQLAAGLAHPQRC
jgi:hypothetical protein